jgi:hypothetical protein
MNNLCLQTQILYIMRDIKSQVCYKGFLYS